MSKYRQLLTKIKIHPLFWAISALAMMTGRFWELLALFTIVLIHEWGHAAAALFFSWKIKRIMILPFGGACEVDEHGNRPLREELIITLAGPLQHAVLALAISLLVAASVVSEGYGLLLHQFNLMVLFFNLLPIWPLDGGRLWRLLLCARLPYLQACRYSLISSFGLLLLLHVYLILFFPLNLHVWIVFGYIYASLWLEWKQLAMVFMKFLLERYYGKETALTELHSLEATGEERLFEMMTRFQRGHKHLILIPDQGKLDENEVLHAYFTDKQVSARLKDIVYND